MDFALPLVSGRLLRRYKRFLADVELPDGDVTTAHCANPGKMTGLAEPGANVWLEPTPDPKRKLSHAWRLVEVEGGLACVDTSAANKVVEEALRAGQIDTLCGYATIQREVKYGANSRIDFLLTDPCRPPCYVEVKSVTLRRGDRAEFPDTVTARGAKHMDELANVALGGGRAVTFYLVQRTDCTEMRVAEDIDPGYAAACARARAAGVETMAFSALITRSSVSLGNTCAFAEAAQA